MWLLAEVSTEQRLWSSFPPFGQQPNPSWEGSPREEGVLGQSMGGVRSAVGTLLGVWREKPEAGRTARPHLPQLEKQKHCSHKPEEKGESAAARPPLGLHGGRAASPPGPGRLTRAGEEGPGQVLRAVESGEHAWGGGSAEQVQLGAHVQLVGLQLHLPGQSVYRGRRPGLCPARHQAADELDNKV